MKRVADTPLRRRAEVAWLVGPDYHCQEAASETGSHLNLAAMASEWRRLRFTPKLAIFRKHPIEAFDFGDARNMNKTVCTILLTARCSVRQRAAANSRLMTGPDGRPARDDVWKETGIVEKFSGPQIPIRWRAAIGSGYSGPTVADGRVFVTDLRTEPSPAERVLCFDWKTGHPLWNFSYDCEYQGISFPAGPRAAVSIDDGRAYALGTDGPPALSRRRHRKGALEESSGRGLQSPHANVGHRRGAAGRWRAGDRPTRRRRSVPGGLG